MKQMAIQLGDLDVQQMEGIVVVTFVDHSRCGDAHSFSRQGVDSDMVRVGEENAFTPNYYYMGNRRAYDKEINPVTSRKPPLRMAFALWPKTAHSQNRSSAPATVFRRVLWESPLDGSVTLSKDAGMLPVARISV